MADQPIWGAAVQRLKVGSTRRLSRINRKALIKEIRSILAPDYAARARELSTKMANPADAVAKAADLLEETARVRA
ncbi:hypothetical protein A9W95_01325 [Mycobacterium sp. 1423905.2]|nr:hypothetical protein A9W95_01325 [Mycobacterium sp. 1423905.2]